jgi:hypothetical protein
MAGVIAVVAAAVAVLAQPKSAINAGQVGASPATIVSSAAVEQYAARVLVAQKSFFALGQRYASRVEQLKLEPPTGVTVDYRGSSPLGFCWLARTNHGVWYTISQDRVNRSQQPIAAAAPISCR